MNLLAVTISRFPEKWYLPEVPWLNLVKTDEIPTYNDGGMGQKEYHGSWKPGSQAPRLYIEFLARKRNKAVELGLEKYPDTTDVMMCDAFYNKQVEPLQQLINDYKIVQDLGITAALGGAAWGTIRMRLEDYFFRRGIEWYDKWGVPDLMFTPYGWRSETDPILKMLNPPLPGLFHTSSLTGISIWPRSIWDKGNRYGTYDDLHGCEHNYFFEHSGILRYTDFNAVFWRHVRRPFTKCLRIKLHLGRFIRKKPRTTNYEMFQEYKT